MGPALVQGSFRLAGMDILSSTSPRPLLAMPQANNNKQKQTKSTRVATDACLSMLIDECSLHVCEESYFNVAKTHALMHGRPKTLYEEGLGLDVVALATLQTYSQCLSNLWAEFAISTKVDLFNYGRVI